MAMENPFEGKEIWFGVGSQDLYGEEALRQVAQQTGEMVDFLNATGKIPAKIVLKPTLKSSDGVKAFMTEASANPNVIGVITWCHTFSPAKMWIRGLEVLTKPLLQLATQHHKEIPWETIDMDFMNLNQAAHGDREFGYIVSRLGIPRKIVVGHYTDPEVAEKVGTWARACAGWDASQNMKVMRWGDNMRNVAVTEGDKTEAERVFGASINTWAVNELVAAYDKVKDDQVKALIEDYKAKYDVAPELLDSRYDELFIAAKEEAAMVNMMRENGCTAAVDNFEDLGTLPQLPGVGPQRFPSEYGWGFSAEGDWKTSVLVRIGAVMGYGLEGGASLMEDYSYNFAPGNELDMGGHFDFFSETSHSDHTESLTEEQQENRKLLREAMERNGFKIANTEWWHFSLIEEPYPKENFNFPVKSLSNMLPKPEEKQSSKSSGKDKKSSKEKKDKKKGKTEKEKKKKKK